MDGSIAMQSAVFVQRSAGQRGNRRYDAREME